MCQLELGDLGRSSHGADSEGSLGHLWSGSCTLPDTQLCLRHSGPASVAHLHTETGTDCETAGHVGAAHC